MRNRNGNPHCGGNGVELIGNSAAMAYVRKEIEKVASANSVVLIQGPTGTGKELVARTIHNRSPRGKGPFIAVNCGAIPGTLIENELFGSVKGAFNGAVDRVGRFEAANGGTLFLDEIGELPLDLQVKLLRVLQEKTVQRLGDNIDRKVDCRVIAATNKDLRDACEAGAFRADLYYRLDVATIKLPPLSERMDDIPLLARYFLQKLPSRMYEHPPAPLISDGAIKALMLHAFPGNVRELENMIEKAIINCDKKLIVVKDLPEIGRGGVETRAELPRVSSLLVEAVRSGLHSGDTEPAKARTRSIRIVKPEDIAIFLTEIGGEFSRKDFAAFLRRCGRHDTNGSVDGTAGRYLRSLRRKGVVKHNSCKANKSRFHLSEEYLS